MKPFPGIIGQLSGSILCQFFNSGHCTGHCDLLPYYMNGLPPEWIILLRLQAYAMSNCFTPIDLRIREFFMFPLIGDGIHQRSAFRVVILHLIR